MRLLKYIILTAILGLLLVLGTLTASAQGGTCRDADAMPNPVVRAGVPGEAVSGGDVGCLIIHNGTEFVQSAAAIGDIGVIRQGVKAAVEISGVTGDGGIVNFGKEIQVCLRGTGAFIYRSAATTPRVSAQLPAVTRELETGTFTCAIVGTTGTAVLVNGDPAPPADDTVAASASEETEVVAGVTEEAGEDAPIVRRSSVNGSISLSGCRVTTTAMVRMRTEPNTSDSEIITRLPYRLSVQAIARTADSDWFEVIYGSNSGWVSGRYLTQSAGCAD